MPASMKTRQAKDKLRRIYQTPFDNFFKKDLKKLTQKTSADEVIKYAEDESSNIYNYAKSLSSGNNNMSDSQTAIDLQSKSLGTKREGLFYKLIASQRSELTDLKSNPKKLPQIKSKIKAFLLATSEKEKDIVDEDVVDDEDKKSKRMHNISIIQKLKSSRISNTLKVFMALVFWDCIKIVEQEIKSEKEKAEKARLQAEQEAKRKANEEAEIKRKKEEEERNEAERLAKEEEEYQAAVKKLKRSA